MSGSMRRFVQVVKHYPGQQQASSRSIYRSRSRCPALGLAEPRWDLSTPVTDVRSTRRRQSSTRRFANFRALHCGHARSRVLGGGGACARACVCTPHAGPNSPGPAWTWALGALGQLASELLQRGRHGAWGRERAAFAVCRNACAGHAWGECV